MSKPAAFLILLALAVLSAAVFGGLHNQLSYSVGQEYFDAFKFDQFGIAPDARGRIAASEVGLMASWWMGLAVGVPAFGVGLLLVRRPHTYLAAGVGAIGVVIVSALFCAMAGLVLGMTEAPILSDYVPVPGTVADPAGFIRAAMMHYGAYLGGLVGAVLAIWTMWRTSKLERRHQAALKGA